MIGKILIGFISSLVGLVGFFFQWSFIQNKPDQVLYAFDAEFYQSAVGLLPIFHTTFNINYLFFLVLLWFFVSFASGFAIEKAPRQLVTLNTSLSVLGTIMMLVLGFEFTTGSFIVFVSFAVISFTFIFDLFISKAI